MIGPQNFFEGANRIYEITPGQFAGTGIGGSAANMMWLRRDLMREANIARCRALGISCAPPARAMQKAPIFGAPLPYARNSMTSLIFVCFVHGAGGSVFTPDLQVNVENDAFRNALEFYKSMREFCPPGATNYSWGDSLTPSWQARRQRESTPAACWPMSPRRTADRRPYQRASLSDDLDERPALAFNDFPSVMIPKGASNLDVTKRFAAHLFRADGYIRQLHAAPGHVLPVLKTIYESPAYQRTR